MPRFIGHYIGISFQSELLIMTLLGLLNSTLEWRPFDWSQQIEKIWNLSLTQQYLIFYTDFEYWIKTRRHHMSLPNLNDAFYRSIFNDCSDNKISRSLTTLNTVGSFESDDTEEVISQIIRNNNLTPAEKCMKLMGLTDADVISARVRVRKRILENNKINKIQEEYAKKNNEIGQIDPLKDYGIKDPFNIDYLMTKTSMSKLYRTNDNQVERTFKDVKRNDGEIFKQTEPYMIENIDERIDDVKVKNELIVELPIKTIEFTQSKESKIISAVDRIDEKEETNLEFVKKKKKKKKVCPLMRDIIKSRPCFPYVQNRQLKECPFKEQNILSDFIFSSYLNKNDKSLDEIYSTTNRKIDDINNDNKIPEENNISSDNVNVKILSKSDTTITNFDQQENTKINCNIFLRSQTNNAKDFIYTELEDNDVLNEANIKPKNSIKKISEKFQIRRNYNNILNNRSSHVFPCTNVFSTIAYLSLCQKLITNPYDREMLIKLIDPRLRFNEEFVKNTNDVDKKTLFKPSSLKNLFDSEQIITQNTMNAELLFKMIEQISCYTDAECKYTSIKSKEKEEEKEDNNDPKNIYESFGNKIHSKYLTNNNFNQLINNENFIENDECYKDNIENELCYCKSWNTMPVEDTSKLSNDTSKIVKESFDNNTNFKYFDKSRQHYVKSLKTKRKLATYSKERELLEMKALRAYNEITLIEDKREMDKKKQEEKKMETIYSFTDNNKCLKMQITSCSKTKSEYKQIDLYELNTRQDHFDSYNEIEIRNMNDSFFEYVSNINNEESIKEKENIHFSNNEPSSSRLPSIQNNDAAIMLNLLDRHGSYWFKQELRRILAIRDSQMHVKHSKPNQVIMKLNLSLRSNENINDSLEFDSNIEKNDISVPSGKLLPHQYLQTKLDLNSNRNLRILNSTESIISKKNVPTNSSNFKDFIEYTKNKKINKEEEEEIKIINIPKESEIEKIDKCKIDIASVEKDDASSSLTNSISNLSPPKIEENIIESYDDFDHRQVKSRNMSLNVMDISKNVQQSLHPRGILLGKQNIQQEINIESFGHCVDQQRDIVDDVTASLIHSAFSYKPEIIIRTFPRDYRSINDERTISFVNNFNNIYCESPLIDNESIIHANNEIDIYAENTLTLTNDQEIEDNDDDNNDDANDLDNILRSSYDSTNTDRIFNFYIFVREDMDLPLDLTIRPTSSDSPSGNEINRDDNDVTLNETMTINIIDPEIDSSLNETIENIDRQFSFDVLIAFFSLILTIYIELLRSYFFSSSSDSHNSVYGYRPYEVHSDNMFKTQFSDELLPKQCDTVVSSNLMNVATELVDQFEEQDKINVIDFTDEVEEEDDQVSIETPNPQVSNIRDSFDTMYTKSTVESENVISFEEGSSMEDFS
ncbi:hypothetical protein M0802_002783 [Mischocyttarus mexicanus]|nr:hypothetical protein M0802_002783 [Mischocyttarus mexicanus]